MTTTTQDIDGIKYTLTTSAPFTATVVGNATTPVNLTNILFNEVVYNGNTYKVTNIANDAFQNNTNLFGYIMIGPNVTSIGEYAFDSSTANLTRCYFLTGSNLTIGPNAFSGCTKFIKYLKIPNSVTTIGANAFNGCTGFNDHLALSNSVTTIGASAFSGCSSFNGSLTIPNSVTFIGASAFNGCSSFNGSLTIPNSVTTIGASAFNGCSSFNGSLFLLQTTPPTINASSFTNVNKVGVIISKFGVPVPTSNNFGMTLAGAAPSGPGDLYLLDLLNNTELVWNGSSWTTPTVNLIDPNEDDTDHQYIITGFDRSKNISGNTSITGITSYGINSYTYTGTNPIINYTVPADLNGVPIVLIKNNAYQNKTILSGSLTIPNSVTTIGGNAFQNCSSFNGSLSLSNNLTTIGASAFSGCSGFNGSLTLSNNLTTIGSNAFQDCFSFNGTLTLSNNLTTIGASAFNNCQNFTGSLTLSNNLTTIGSNAFQDCFSFNGTLTLSNNLTTIEDAVFNGCKNFTGSLTLSNNLTTIGSNAFQDCSSFTGSLTIPDSVTTIGESAFRACSGFDGNLTLSNTLTTIGASAFNNCQNFTGSLTIPNTLTAIASSTFQGCSRFDGGLIIPNTVTTIGASAFSGCSGFNGSLIIPNSVTTIGNDAFYNCSDLSGSLFLLRNSNVHLTPGASSFTNVNKIGVIISNLFWPPVDNFGMTASDTSGSGELYLLDLFYNNTESIWNEGWNTSPNISLIAPNDNDTNHEYIITGFDRSQNNSGSSPTEGITSYGINSYTGGSVVNYTVPATYNNKPIVLIRTSAYQNKTGLTGSLTIPDSIIIIGPNAFWGCNGFNGSLTIPDSVIFIDNGAFFGCEGFNGSLTIPNSVTTIGDNAFNGTNFTGSLTIPNSVTYIGSDAFYNCRNFTTIYYAADSTNNINPFTNTVDVFMNTTNLTTIYYTGGNADLRNLAFWRYYLGVSQTVNLNNFAPP
jgi:hypothetical protein